jgi:N-acetylglucosaminyl-diphospho-decaprenol L-rhamnosyltransferase
MSIHQEQTAVSARRRVAPDLAFAPELSICIVNWNCSDYLRHLLGSIEAGCEDVVMEIIVVDNASTDDSASMVEAEFPDVQLIRNARHQGVAAANNRAATRCHGKFLLFLNDDTRIAPGSLTTLVRFFERHPEVSAVGPSLIFPNGKRQGCVRKALTFQALLHRVLFLRWTGLFRAANREYQQLDFDLAQSGYVEHVVGAALLVRRQQFMSIGGWDETFEFHMDDVDLSSRLARFGPMYYLADAHVFHWGGIATELDRNYAYRWSECSYVHYIRKHCSRRSARIYKILITADMPLRVTILAVTWLVKLFGKRERASRNYRKLVAASQFLLRQLPHYWRY